MANDYPPDWDRRRKEVYKRDKYTCQNCGRRGKPHGSARLHAHHIVPKSSGGTHKKSNLQTVCRECHQAIHGSNIAPSARNQPLSKQDYSVSLDIDDFPYAASDFVDFGNKLEKATNQLETTVEALDDFLDILHTEISSSFEERPTHAHNQYEQCNEQAMEAIQNLEDQIDTLTQQQPEFSNTASIEEYERFSENATTTVSLLKQYHSSIVELIESEEISKDELADFKVLDNNTNESVNGFVDSAEDLMAATSGEIRQILNELTQGTSRFAGINPYDECPVCGAPDDEMLISDELELIRCTKCRTEFQADSLMTWKAVYSPKSIENVSLTIDMWKKLDIDGQSKTDQIEKLEQASNRQSKVHKRGILGVAAIEVLGLIWSFSTGNYIALVFVVILSIVIGFISIKATESVVLPNDI